MTPKTRRDDGFTLVELLIAVAALGILLPSIAATFYIGLKTTDETNRRFLDSHDVQSAAAFVNSDVQNAQLVSVNNTTTCTSASYAPSSAGLYLAWTDKANGGAVSHQVNYYVSGKSLIRSQCVGSTASAIAIIQDLAFSAGPPSSPVLDVVCQPTACTSATTPTSIALRGETVSGQMFSLIGTRRTSP
jgi:prepilin-type N-terminal cleavage/methylation domain-containing protein